MDKTFGKKNYENISKKHQTNDKKYLLVINEL